MDKPYVDFSSGIGKPVYFYRVSEFVSVPAKNIEDQKSFDHTDDFHHDDLRMARELAIADYLNKLKNYGGHFHKPYASPKEFVLGEHSTYSLTCSLVESYSHEDIEHTILGESDDEVAESLETERMVFEYLGY